MPALLSRTVLPATAALVAFGCTAGLAAGEEGADQERRVERLEKQVATLKASYAQARIDAERADAKLAEIRSRLEALGGSALGDSEQRLIETVGELETVHAELDAVKKSSLKLYGAVMAYMRQALAEDAEARAAVESAMRELDVALGFRNEPARDIAGTLDNASVLSIDSESGLIVINAGREAGMRVGMPVDISRGDQVIARTIVTDVRKEVAGVLVRKRMSPTLAVAVGDRASIQTNE